MTEIPGHGNILTNGLKGDSCCEYYSNFKNWTWPVTNGTPLEKQSRRGKEGEEFGDSSSEDDPLLTSSGEGPSHADIQGVPLRLRFDKRRLPAVTSRLQAASKISSRYPLGPLCVTFGDRHAFHEVWLSSVALQYPQCLCPPVLLTFGERHLLAAGQTSGPGIPRAS